MKGEPHSLSQSLLGWLISIFFCPEHFKKRKVWNWNKSVMEISLLCVIANILDLCQEFQFRENVFQLSGDNNHKASYYELHLESFRPK